MNNIEILKPADKICKKTDFQDLLKQLPDAREEERNLQKKIESLFDKDPKLKETYKKVENAQAALNAALNEAQQQQNKLLETDEGQKYMKDLKLAQDRYQQMQQKLCMALEDEMEKVLQDKCDESTKKKKQLLLMKAGAEATFGKDIAQHVSHIFGSSSTGVLVRFSA